MKSTLATTLVTLISCGASFGAAVADPDLPQPFDPATLQTLVTASPFNRAINPSDSLVLTGLAFVNGKPIANLFDTETKKTHVLSEKPNREGWQLLSAVPARDFKQSQISVKIGTEVVTIRTNAAAVNDSKKGGNQPPGPDRGPRESRGPGSGDKGYSRSGHGPSKEDIERFKALSPETQEKVKNFFRENRDKVMGMSDDDRRDFIRSNVDKIAAEDNPNKSGGGKKSR